MRGRVASFLYCGHELVHVHLYVHDIESVTYSSGCGVNIF